MKKIEYKGFEIILDGEKDCWYSSIFRISDGYDPCGYVASGVPKEDALDDAKLTIDGLTEKTKYFKVTYSGHDIYFGTIYWSEDDWETALFEDIRIMDVGENVTLKIEPVMISESEVIEMGEFEGW